VDPAAEWDELAKSGTTILGYSYFGRWRLPPDWLKLGERVSPGGPPPERFGYDAVRIPIYLVWARRETEALMRPYREFWGHFDGHKWLPAWTNLKDDSIDTQDADAGIKAVAQLVREWPRRRPTGCRRSIAASRTTRRSCSCCARWHCGSAGRGNPYWPAAASRAKSK
jgi:endoglucanase